MPEAAGGGGVAFDATVISDDTAARIAFWTAAVEHTSGQVEAIEAILAKADAAREKALAEVDAVEERIAETQKIRDEIAAAYDDAVANLAVIVPPGTERE